MPTERFQFTGEGGHQLAAALELPDGEPTAYALFAAGLAIAFLAQRDRPLAPGSKAVALAVAIVVTLQAGLGIWTLMASVPIALGVLHQAGAAVLLGTATVFAWRVRRP